jgi:hypothetical protein
VADGVRELEHVRDGQRRERADQEVPITDGQAARKANAK